MDRFLGRFSPYIYALMRIVVGLLFACHGAQKLFGVLGGIGGEPGGAAPLLSLMGLAGIIEFAGGICIAVGLWTSWVAFITSGEMAVAYFMAHAPQGFFPIVNRGELAAVYAFVFLFVASKGSGTWSIDSAFRKAG